MTPENFSWIVAAGSIHLMLLTAILVTQIGRR